MNIIGLASIASLFTPSTYPGTKHSPLNSLSGAGNSCSSIRNTMSASPAFQNGATMHTAWILNILQESGNELNRPSRVKKEMRLVNLYSTQEQIQAQIVAGKSCRESWEEVSEKLGIYSDEARLALKRLALERMEYLENLQAQIQAGEFCEKFRYDGFEDKKNH